MMAVVVVMITITKMRPTKGVSERWDGGDSMVFSRLNVSRGSRLVDGGSPNVGGNRWLLSGVGGEVAHDGNDVGG